jgi:4-amino-4-deoxy-L-arabinose transferase-like glycosyltransferase
MDTGKKDASVYAVLVLVPTFAYFFSGIQVMPHGIDPWFYYAYATDFSSLLHRFGWTYYAARLSWISFQALFYYIFSAPVAHFVIGLAASFVGTASLYTIIRTYFGRPAAFVSALALAANPLFITGSFWSYVDGPVVSASLLSIAAFIRGHEEGKPAYLVLAGVASAFAILAHIIAILIIFPAFLFILIYHQQKLSAAIGNFMAAALSFLGAVLLTCGATQIFFGQFWFFLITGDATRWVVGGGWHGWVRPIATWIHGATAITMPPAVFLLTAQVLRRRPPSPIEFAHGRWIFPYNMYFLLLYAFLDFVLHAGRLQHIEYFRYLFVPIYLLVGQFMGYLLSDLKGHRDAYVLYAGGFLIAFILMGLTKWVTFAPTGPTWILLATLFASLFCIISLARKITTPQEISIALAVILFLFLAAAADDRNAPRPSSNNEGYFRTVVAAQQFINQNVPPKRKVLFWYRVHPPMRDTYAGINSLYTMGIARLNGNMPDLPTADLKKIDTEMTIVMLFSAEAEVQDAFRALSQKCLSPDLSAKTSLGYGTTRIGIWIVDVGKWTACHGSGLKERTRRTGWRMLLPDLNPASVRGATPSTGQ